MNSQRKKTLTRAVKPLVKPLVQMRKEVDLVVSNNVDVEGVRTVCLTLGPYRNLTTLTASTLALHPNCQVLNHGGIRILGDRRLDFLLNYSDKRFRTFTKYAIHISQSGRRGTYGGSITFSHAFDKQHAMKDLLETSTGAKPRKEIIRALFWKESLKTSNHIRKHGVDLDSIFSRNEQLRFLLPIRNPLDCAKSNLRTGHVNLFESVSSNSSMEDVLEAILDEFLWVENLRLKHPERFFIFFEHEFNRETLMELAKFLELEFQEDWCNKALNAFNIKKGQYDHPADLIHFYRQCISSKFSDHPEFASKLLQLVRV